MAEVREDIYFHPCLCDACYIGVKGDIDDRDAIEEILRKINILEEIINKP